MYACYLFKKRSFIKRCGVCVGVSWCVFAVVLYICCGVCIFLCVYIVLFFVLAWRPDGVAPSLLESKGAGVR